MEKIISFAIWSLLIYGVAKLGSQRVIGFRTSMIVSILMTPLVGLIVVLCSPIAEKKSAINKPLHSQ